MTFATITNIAQVQGVPVVCAALMAAGHKVLRHDGTTVVVEIAGTRDGAEAAVRAVVEGVKAANSYGIEVSFVGRSA